MPTPYRAERCPDCGGAGRHYMGNQSWQCKRCLGDGSIYVPMDPPPKQRRKRHGITTTEEASDDD